jgi:hypothetical protein
MNDSRTKSNEFLHQLRQVSIGTDLMQAPYSHVLIQDENRSNSQGGTNLHSLQPSMDGMSDKFVIKSKLDPETLLHSNSINNREYAGFDRSSDVYRLSNPISLHGVSKDLKISILSKQS